MNPLYGKICEPLDARTTITVKSLNRNGSVNLRKSNTGRQNPNTDQSLIMDNPKDIFDRHHNTCEPTQIKILLFPRMLMLP
jgi:hypothetical protein